MDTDSDERLALSNWGLSLLRKFLHPLTVFGTPTFLLALLIYFLMRAFRTDLAYGIRSLAGFLLPLIVSTFIFIYQKEILAKLGDVNVVISFIISLIWGVIIMVVVRLFTAMASPVPVNELVLSSSFSVLVFSYVSLPQNKVLSYYYGTVSGLLLYIIFFGFPIIGFVPR
jgi:hypothetical protein